MYVIIHVYALSTHTYTCINGEVTNEGGLETKSLYLSHVLLSIFLYFSHFSWNTLSFLNSSYDTEQCVILSHVLFPRMKIM